jgi:8-oxo-dGTP pyrophosphatase MutT (NUDIX family)
MKPDSIRVVAICLFRVEDRILVFEAFDSVRGTPFYRPLGGGVEPGETTRETIQREIREELGLEVTDLHLLGALENLFTCEGELGHEIVFVYDGRFADESAYQRSVLTVTEDNGETLKARWRALDSFDECHRLVPEALISLLGDAA